VGGRKERGGGEREDRQKITFAHDHGNFQDVKEKKKKGTGETGVTSEPQLPAHILPSHDALPSAARTQSPILPYREEEERKRKRYRTPRPLF